MKVSIITVTLNSEKTLEKTILSVLSQDYSNIEYIIVDGCSSDNTINIINKYKSSISQIIIEKDKSLYDAINKGIKISTGDIIGILNSDDHFISSNIISKILENNVFDSYDAVIGNINFINSQNKIKRTISSKNFSLFQFRFGIMPPHPSFYCKRYIYEKFGLYDLNYKISSDFDLMLRFLLINKVKFKKLNFTFVNMRLNGKSTKSLSSNIIINKEIYLSLRNSNIYTNFFLIYLKYIYKIFQIKIFSLEKL